MREQNGDLFEQANAVIVICTNGYVSASGYAELKSETAIQASRIWPGLSPSLGENIRREGSICQVVMTYFSSRVPLTVVSFPTKPGKVYLTNKKNLIKSAAPKDPSLSYLPGWTAKSNLDIIRHSAEELVDLANKMNWAIVYLPRVGCGSGELKWKQVKETIQGILDDRFVVLRLPKNKEKFKNENPLSMDGHLLETGVLLE